MIETSAEAVAGVASWECGPPTVQIAYTAPPGLRVIVGQPPDEPPPRPQNTNWLAVTVTVAVYRPGQPHDGRADAACRHAQSRPGVRGPARHG